MSRPQDMVPELGHVVRHDGREHVAVDRLLPRGARNLLLDEIIAVLQDAGVMCFVSKAALFPAATVGILGEQRRAALQAIGRVLPGPGRYLQENYANAADQPIRRLTAGNVEELPPRCQAFTVARFWSVAKGLLKYGMDYGVRVEFWLPSDERRDVFRAPPGNAAATVAHRDYFTPATITVDGRQRPSIALFDRLFLPEVDFPVDAVYTWVDGADPAWRERFSRARAVAGGDEYHPQAQAANRYQSRDELKYSLRSVEMYAPWLRHVYLVTDQQVPPWLDPDCDRITVVDHRDIFRDPDALPVFNSSAIISQLHHISGLSEHYLYLNDDMFFGRDVRPEAFFHGSGIAKVFPSIVNREFGPADAADEPHFNISKNIRAFMERELGRSVSLALRHTPYPQIRSVLAEIEQKYPAVVDTTAHQRFRHHDDIALDQLFHYYAQATGRAVPEPIPYEYVNVGHAPSAVRLRRLLALREWDVFCLNDAPDADGDPIPPGEVAAFLDAYFPMPSSFER